ncbi:GHMP kinase [Natranaerobius thermophilus]|uniref:GHMP kinase n=1 Tax=Natranaerobius thermophilus (strain ATCC BAA-1301 / DSM 18059 / JW/NM-WN-LF) TaxID=457570 RepID=B2A0G6_NATTJ|nr:GHMP kinase [Natranaerobius thermophilus]ACB84527.1 GHMP kinase [Natranaerobius thermophilus JW/NM-WN-LF]
MKSQVKVPLTCGEWVQGTIDGQDFLVSCPINAFSIVTLELFAVDERTEVKPISGVRYGPHGFPQIPGKAIQALQRFVSEPNNDLNIPSKIKIADKYGMNLTIKSDLPSAQGFGTSSADIYGTLYNLYNLIGASFHDQYILSSSLARQATKIEPSDTNCFRQLTAMNHRTGKGATYLGTVPKGQVAILNFYGSVDTEKFNQQKNLRELNKIKEPQVEAAYRYLLHGIRIKDLKLMAKGSTLGARSHQEVLHREEVEKILELYPKAGALGVIRAHSGTALGLIYPEGDLYKKYFREWYLKYQIEDTAEFLGFYNLVNGGID